ncbi:MAG: hypothetical protein ACYDAL_13075 [Candidatus Dormibacteraceae bacterium]
MNPADREFIQGGRDAFDEVVTLLDALHRPKDRAYGDAWRRRGEVLGIFANIARKVDRLEVAMGEAEPSPVESLGDTAADLAIYSGKYLTWLAEMYPSDFSFVPPSPSASQCSARRGPDALRTVLDHLGFWEQGREAIPPRNTQDAWQLILASFRVLETGLMAQADNQGNECLTPLEKIGLAWALMDASTWFVVRLGEADVAQLDRLRLESTGDHRA